MIHSKVYILCAAGGLLVTLGGCRTLNDKQTSQVQNVSRETTSTLIEDGGTGPYSALMVSDSSLATHTIFRPKDLNGFGRINKLPIIAWGNGACA
ncbi:MAG: hypothetical protein ABFD91_08940, partial [Anaerohalosphaeraceae bacterium]